MIILTPDTGTVALPDVGAEALCVRHPKYVAPTTGPACTHMTFPEFERDPRGAANGKRVLVMVGMNRIISPANRTQNVFEFLHNDSRHLRKISVDRTLFVAEPWRTWFHFGFVGAPYREYTYSYLAETHWRAAQDGLRGDPFSLEAISAAGDDVVRATYASYFDLSTETLALSASAHQDYQKLKAACFDEEHTIAAILRRLGEFAQQSHPWRTLPTPASLFEHRTHRLRVTDLPIDRYLVGRLRALADLTNAIGAHFYGR